MNQHGFGQGGLVSGTRRLTTCIRASDTACRYGGDEFVILLPELDGPQSAVSTAAKMREYLAAPYHVDATVINMTTSIGIALYPADGQECGDLIHVSDLQRYRDKTRASAVPSIVDRSPVT